MLFKHGHNKRQERDAMTYEAATVANESAEQEHRFHDYLGRDIPWYVRAMWIGFWIFAVYYTVVNLIPAMQRELIVERSPRSVTVQGN